MGLGYYCLFRGAANFYLRHVRNYFADPRTNVLAYCSNATRKRVRGCFVGSENAATEEDINFEHQGLIGVELC
jgi:hypothetical protein